MNNVIQNILVFSAVILAVISIVKKFLPKKVKSNSTCGNETNCGCH